MLALSSPSEIVYYLTFKISLVEQWSFVRKQMINTWKQKTNGKHGGSQVVLKSCKSMLNGSRKKIKRGRKVFGCSNKNKRCRGLAKTRRVTTCEI